MAGDSWAPAGAAKVAGLRFGGGVEPGHACYPMRWLLVAALTGCANANGCYDTCCFAPSCPGPGSDSGAPAGGLVGPAGSGGEAATRGAAVCPAGYTRKLQSCAIPCCVPDAGTNGTCCQLGRRPGPHSNGTLAVPTDVQLAWQDFEVGALNSFQMVTFWGGQLSADRPFNLSRPEEFTAQDLDTDQWAEAVVAMGGKYQVLNVKDESGFLLWPTQFKWEGKLYNYTVRESPLRPKGRDIIKEYVTAAKKKGVETVRLDKPKPHDMASCQQPLRCVGLSGHLLPAVGQLPPQRHARG